MAIRAKFTDSFIQKLEQLPAGKREIYIDTIEPNLQLRVTSSGKNLFLRFKYLGKQYERNLDEQRNVYQARLEVEQRKVEIRSGNERLAATKARMAAEQIQAEQVADQNKTLSEMVEEYLTARTANVGDRLSERTESDYRELMAAELAPYKDDLIDSITRQRSITMLNEIATAIIERSKKSIKKSGDADRKQRTGARANYALKLVRSVCNFTGRGNQHWGKLKGSAYPWIPSKPATTGLDPDIGHGRSIWQSLSGKRKDTGAAFLKAVLLTGCRRNEMGSLTVGQVNLTTNEILLKDTKNGTDHRVFISPQLKEVLEPLLIDEEGKKRNKGENVFPTACDPRKLLNSVSNEVGVKFTTHSLRKYFAINGMSIGTPLPVIKACLNHSMKGGDVTVSSYAQPTPSQMRAAWVKHADSICPKNATIINLDSHRRTA